MLKACVRFMGLAVLTTVDSERLHLPQLAALRPQRRRVALCCQTVPSSSTPIWPEASHRYPLNPTYSEREIEQALPRQGRKPSWADTVLRAHQAFKSNRACDSHCHHLNEHLPPTLRVLFRSSREDGRPSHYAAAGRPVF